MSLHAVKKPVGVKLPIYLDYQATTPTDPRVVEAMLPYFSEQFGNPSSSQHVFGWDAGSAVQTAREEVAGVINASHKEIIFTSGATESCNLAIKGFARFHAAEGGKRRHIITVATEHKAALASCEALTQEGFELTVLPVGEDGLLDVTTFASALRDDTLLVSVMAVNNEIGVVQPLAEIGALCRKSGACFHTDAAQAFGKIPLDVEAMQIDLLSISGHKVYAPKGIGALYVRRRPRVRLEPLFSGGSQERTLRSGTLPVPLVVGMSKAAQLAASEMKAEQARLLAMRDRFLKALEPVRKHFHVNGSLEHRIAGNISLRFPGVNEASLLERLGDLAVSSGSACNSAALAPSYVLDALGLRPEESQTSLRFGFGRFTTEAEMDYAAKLLIETLHRMS